ncbi:MAG: hypothetical protein MMC33_000652 [Icmadophila ericetorum]|nr:hypothetical protein [Icmadophila ericetorum]
MSIDPSPTSNLSPIPLNSLDMINIDARLGMSDQLSDALRTTNVPQSHHHEVIRAVINVNTKTDDPHTDLATHTCVPKPKTDTELLLGNGGVSTTKTHQNLARPDAAATTIIKKTIYEMADDTEMNALKDKNTRQEGDKWVIT